MGYNHYLVLYGRIKNCTKVYLTTYIRVTHGNASNQELSNQSPDFQKFFNNKHKGRERFSVFCYLCSPKP